MLRLEFLPRVLEGEEGGAVAGLAAANREQAWGGWRGVKEDSDMGAVHVISLRSWGPRWRLPSVPSRSGMC